MWREGPAGWRALEEQAARVRTETDVALSLPSDDPAALFDSPDGAFRLSGAVRRVGYGALTVARESLPPTVLEIRPNTSIRLNGVPARLSELPVGAPVRALFQLQGSAPVALEVSARSASDGAGRERERHQELDVTP